MICIELASNSSRAALVGVKESSRILKGTNEFMTWYNSSTDYNISGPSTAKQEAGMLYFHKNSSTNGQQIWMYLGKKDGWLDITTQYLADDGTVHHPTIPDRVLTVRDATGAPSFVKRRTYELKQKQKEKDEQEAYSSDAQESS